MMIEHMIPFMPMSTVTILDDVISLGYQNLIENLFNSDSYNWNHISGLTFDDDNNTGFVSKIFHSDEKIKKPETDLLLPLLCEGVNKYTEGWQYKNLFRIMARMTLKNQNSSTHLPHVDYEIPHFTMLYYVNDSDSGTNIHDEGKIIRSIEQKKGRVVIMTGNILHSSTTPKVTSNRKVLNFNFLM